MAYCTIQDVRDEGFADPPYTDARITRAIGLACELIERVTCRWFEPRQMSFDLRWPGSPDLLVAHPIIRVDDVLFVNTDGSTSAPLVPADYIVFNRHVRTGQLNERDDREDPKLAFQFLRPDLVVPRPRKRRLVQDLLTRREQNVRVTGWFGYTDPIFAADRTIAADPGDGITAPNTIKMVNGAFTSADIGKEIVLAGTAGGTQDGAKLIIAVPAADTVTVRETLTTEGTGFTATLNNYPQFGKTPEAIKDVCIRLAARNLPTIGQQTTGTGVISPNRITRMATRDQSISMVMDPRLQSGSTGGDGSITGDPEIDRVLTMFRCPPRMGAA